MPQRSATYYAVIRERGENWDARLPMRQQEQWEEHAAFMDALAEDGFVILDGPLGDGEEKFLHIIAAESEQAGQRCAPARQVTRASGRRTLQRPARNSGVQPLTAPGQEH